VYHRERRVSASARSASASPRTRLTPHLTIDGFAFDVELFYLARLAGFRIPEVGITGHCRQDSRVRVGAGIASVLDLLRIRFTGRPFGRPVLRRASRSPPAALSDPD
jgi:hypothetical protein